MNWSIFKNPIILAIIAAVITFLYLYYENKKKIKKNPPEKQESTNIWIPAVVAVVVWFIASRVFASATLSEDVNNIDGNQASTMTLPSQLPVQSGGSSLMRGVNNNIIAHKPSFSEANSFESQTFHLVGKGSIKLPQTDVFIDIAKF